MDYTSSDARYAKNLMNDMLIGMLGVPRKYHGGRSFGGYWSLINKWMYSDKYDLQYVYYVISKLYEKDIKMTAGFIEGALRSEKWISSYDPEVNKIPSGGSREALLKSGHTIDTLPAHLLTRDERKERKQSTVPIVNANEDDRENLSKLIEAAGGVVANSK